MNHERPFDLDAEFQAVNQELDAQTSARIAELQQEIDQLRGKLKSVQEERERAEMINGRKKLQELYSIAQDLGLDAEQSLVLLGTYLPQDCLELLAERAVKYWGYPNEYQAQMGRESGFRNNPLEIVARLLKEQAPVPHLDTLVLEDEDDSFWWRLLGIVSRHRDKKHDSKRILEAVQREVSEEEFSQLLNLLMKHFSFPSHFALFLAFERGLSAFHVLPALALGQGKKDLINLLDRRLEEWHSGQHPQTKYSQDS